jgi:hypothetical protein
MSVLEERQEVLPFEQVRRLTFTRLHIIVLA